MFELQTAVLPYNLELNSSENIETGKITSELTDNKKLLAKLEFNRNSGIKRDVFELCIVLENMEKYSIEEINKILNYSSYYTVFLPRNLNRIDLQAEIINSRKEYIICFEIGDVQDYEADFRKSQEIRQKINDICNYYQKDKGLILFNPKKIYDFEKEIISNLSSCRGNIYTDTVLTNLKLSNGAEKKYLELESEIEKLSKSQRVRKAIVIDIPYSEFLNFISVLQKLERKGFRFVSFLDYFKQK